MNYEKRILCYFDILGFSDIVNGKALSSNDIKSLFDEIAIIICEYAQDNISILHFSDSFAISIRHRNNAPTQLKITIDILEKLLEYGLLVRGAIVFGEILHYETNIFGPALIKAVEMEKKAKYPRLILDESLDELPLPTIGNGSITYRQYFNVNAFVKTDPLDKIFYIDFIGELKKKNRLDRHIPKLESLIQIGLSDAGLNEKYQWLRDKLTSVYP